MAKTAHTQGPWFIRKNLNGRGALDLFGEGGQIIIGNALLINQEANARLIAAAPELLEICEEIIEVLQWRPIDRSPKTLDRLRTIIARAKGAENDLRRFNPPVGA